MWEAAIHITQRDENSSYVRRATAYPWKIVGVNCSCEKTYPSAREVRRRATTLTVIISLFTIAPLTQIHDSWPMDEWSECMESRLTMRSCYKKHYFEAEIFAVFYFQRPTASSQRGSYRNGDSGKLHWFFIWCLVCNLQHIQWIATNLKRSVCTLFTVDHCKWECAIAHKLSQLNEESITSHCRDFVSLFRTE